MIHHQGGSYQFDVLNLGVAGYSTKDEASQIKSKALIWNPRLLVIGYCLNDPEIDPIYELHNYFNKSMWWQRYNVFRRIALAKRNFDLKIFGGGNYIKYLHIENRKKWQSVLKAFGDIREMTQKRSIEVLVVIFPMIPNQQCWSRYSYQDIHKQVSSAAKKWFSCCRSV